MARMILIRAIRNDMVNDLVVRNDVPAGKAGWLSRSLGLEQVLAVLDATDVRIAQTGL
jgi:hypothetical protein